MAYDLITMGRIGVDRYPLQTGVPLAEVTSSGAFPGGSAANAAVAAARMDPERGTRYAGAAGVIVASRPACSPARPTPAEVAAAPDAGAVR